MFATLALVCAMGGWFLHKPWMGVKVDGGSVVQVGRYRSLDECRKDVATWGHDWCGKDCREYKQGSIADCEPLVHVP